MENNEKINGKIRRNMLKDTEMKRTKKETTNGRNKYEKQRMKWRSRTIGRISGMLIIIKTV